MLRQCQILLGLVLGLLGTAAGIPVFEQRVVAAEAAGVSLEQEDHSLKISIGGEWFTTYHFAADQAKPYFAPLHLPGGKVVTRAIGDTADNDHPHHTGLWISVDEVGESKHWMGREKIVSQKVESKIDGDNGIITLENHWNDAGGTAQLVENTLVTIYPDRLMSFDIQLATAGPAITTHDTKEGFFGVRVASSLREKVGGVVTSASGAKGTAACWGQTSPWVDYSGEVDHELGGIALFDHPGNFRPARYHVRDYGLFTISPFGEGAYQNDSAKAEPVTILPEHPLRLRYAAFIHPGDAATGRVADEFARWHDKAP